MLWPFLNRQSRKKSSGGCRNRSHLLHWLNITGKRLCNGLSGYLPESCYHGRYVVKYLSHSLSSSPLSFLLRKQREEEPETRGLRHGRLEHRRRRQGQFHRCLLSPKPSHLNSAHLSDRFPRSLGCPRTIEEINWPLLLAFSQISYSVVPCLQSHWGFDFLRVYLNKNG